MFATSYLLVPLEPHTRRGIATHFFRVFCASSRLFFLLDTRLWKLDRFDIATKGSKFTKKVERRESSVERDQSCSPPVTCLSRWNRTPVGGSQRISFFAFFVLLRGYFSCSTLDSGRSAGLISPQKGSKFTKKVERPGASVKRHSLSVLHQLLACPAGTAHP